MISLLCKHCHKLFYVKPYRAKTALCCSRKCLWYITKSQREPQRLASIINKKSYNNKQIEIKCRKCENLFLISPSRQGISKFCSKNCFSEAAKMPKKSPYIRILVDGKRVHEHRHMMENHLGRKLLPTEHVHHINHDHLDNHLNNLEVLSIADHTGKHKRSF